MSTDTSPTESSSPFAVFSDRHRKAFAAVFGEAYLRDFQDPLTFVDCTFWSPAVQTSFRRDFALISRTLFAEYIYRRRREYDQAVLDRFAQVCEGKLAAISQLLTTNTNRVAKLLAQSGTMLEAGYLQSLTRTVPIIHGNAMRYIRCLQLLDQLLIATGSAVLNGTLSTEQRRNVELQSRRAIKAFSSMVRNESINLRKEAQRMLSADSRDAPAGGSPGAAEGSNAQIAAAMELQTAAIATFDEHSKAEDSATPQARVDSANPGADLDAAVASGLAAAGTPAKPRRSSAKSAATSTASGGGDPTPGG